MFQVEILASNRTVVCLVRGSLDASTVTTFRGAVHLYVHEPGLIIDLSGVDFIDGAGLTALVGTIRRAQDHRTRVAVVVPAGPPRSVLDNAGLELIVKLAETADMAMRAIHEGERIGNGSIAIAD